MTSKLKRYKREAEHSYAFGVFPTLELLQQRPEIVQSVLLHSRGAHNEGIAKTATICQARRIPHTIDDRAFERLGARENDYAIGVFRKVSIPLDPAANHVVLVNPGNMGNLGTILRTMLGFGIRDLALIRPAADIYHPDVVRASMGAIFQVAFAYFDSLEAYCNAFARNLYLFMTDGKTRLDRLECRSPFALVFGNESSGLPAELEVLGTSVLIPYDRRVDSLNLAVAVGIALYVCMKPSG